MDWLIAVAAAVAAGLAGVEAARWQHLLYRNPEHRVRGGGRWHRVRIAFVAIGFGAVVLLALRPGHYDAGPALLTALFCAAMVLLSSTDFERKLLPDRLMLPAIVLAAAVCWAWPDRSIADIWIGAGIAFAAGAGLFILGAFFGAGRGGAIPFGMGDAKLILLIGLLTGWPAFGTALLIGILSAGIPAVVLVLAGKGGTAFSYGPYLAAGGTVVMLFPGSFV